MACHLWPGITPMNVYDVQYRVWQAMARVVDAYIEQTKASERELERQVR